MLLFTEINTFINS